MNKKDDLVKKVAMYYIENKTTTRDTAKAFGYSKSWVCRVFNEKLPKISPELHKKVKEVTQENLINRHRNGGLATKYKYKGVTQ